MYLIWTLVSTADFFVLPDWTHQFWLRILRFTEVKHTDYDYRYFDLKWGSRRVWPISRGCLLLRDTWSCLRICRRSVLSYTRFCNWLLDYDCVLHIVNFAILYYVPLLLRHGTSVFKFISERPAVLSSDCRSLGKGFYTTVTNRPMDTNVLALDTNGILRWIQINVPYGILL
jgi:hypothetical protein